VYKLAGWGGIFFMVCRNNAGRLGDGFMSVCLETRWLGQNGGFMSWNDSVIHVQFSIWKKQLVKSMEVA